MKKRSLLNPSQYGWTDNTFETTAYAIRALLTADAVICCRFFCTVVTGAPPGGMWNTTKDTAAVVEAVMAMSVADDRSDGGDRIRQRNRTGHNARRAGYVVRWICTSIPATGTRSESLRIEMVMAVSIGPVSSNTARQLRSNGLTVTRRYGRVAHRNSLAARRWRMLSH